jgi:hypothetical protein
MRECIEYLYSAENIIIKPSSTASHNPSKLNFFHQQNEVPMHFLDSDGSCFNFNEPYG